MTDIRVRFAPSPTGTLHIGGVRTLLYNYLLSKKYAGKLIIRIEDTDRKRYVEGSEEYIRKTMDWLGIVPDESLWHGGDFGPYRQSERLEIYQQIAHDLVRRGYAYYAFDSVEDLEKMRRETHSRKYDAQTRTKMLNSLGIGEAELREYMENRPYVIRLRTPENEIIRARDLLRGEMQFNPEVLEDKVLLKEDGYPTYHLAVVVDDLHMQISHVLRGEEWLSSLPAHVLLWRYLGEEMHMPKWIHLPLLLRPDGAGKLSKRDGMELGIPVLPLSSDHPPMPGFREQGFLPEALINALALSAWHKEDGKEIFPRTELIKAFSLENLHYQSVKFDLDKAKWVNLQHIRNLSSSELLNLLQQELSKHNISHNYSVEQISTIIDKTRERYSSLIDIWEHVAYFFMPTKIIDFNSLQGKNIAGLTNIIQEFIAELQGSTEIIDDIFCRNFFNVERLSKNGIKMGELQLALRILLVGAKKGIALFDIVSLLQKSDLLSRLEYGLNLMLEKFT